jgi:hypothetical protein
MPGSVISMRMTNAAQHGWSYTLRYGAEALEERQGRGNGFTVINQAPGSLGFGLAQAANINDVSVTTVPASAVIMQPQSMGRFTPQEQITIFLSPNSQAGTVLSELPGNALTLTLSGQSPVANLAYNDDTNTFKLISQSSSLAPTSDSPKTGLEFATSHGA